MIVCYTLGSTAEFIFQVNQHTHSSKSPYSVGTSSGSRSDPYFKFHEKVTCLPGQYALGDTVEEEIVSEQGTTLCHFTANMNDEAKMTL